MHYFGCSGIKKPVERFSADCLGYCAQIALSPREERCIPGGVVSLLFPALIELPVDSLIPRLRKGLLDFLNSVLGRIPCLIVKSNTKVVPNRIEFLPLG